MKMKLHGHTHCLMSDSPKPIRLFASALLIAVSVLSLRAEFKEVLVIELMSGYKFNLPLDRSKNRTISFWTKSGNIDDDGKWLKFETNYDTYDFADVNCYYIQNAYTGINDIDNDTGVTEQPLITIYNDHIIFQGVCNDIRVYDLKGRLYATMKPLENGEATIDTSNMGKGLWLFKTGETGFKYLKK